MVKRRFGFTLTEVALFLAVTAAIFIGVIAGTQNTIWHQRYNDSVQDFAEFMRSIYSQVSNPQSIGTGQSDAAIYGKLVVFGEEIGLDYNAIPSKDNKVFVYDVVGDVSGNILGGGLKEALSNLKVNVVIGLTEDGKTVNLTSNNRDTTRIKMVTPTGIVQSYSPRWMSTIEAIEPENGILQLYKGSILVVRHPKSGTINTLVSSTVIEVNKAVKEANISLGNDGGTAASASNVVGNLLTRVLDDGSNSGFKNVDTDFCVNPNGQDNIRVNNSNDLKTLTRRDVRLVKNARNASGVEVIDLDSTDNRCRYGN